MSRRTDPPSGPDTAAATATPVSTERWTPFVHRLQPTWGDTDAARMVYTGRFPDYALRAIDAWMLEHVGVDFYRMNEEWGLGTPFVHLECDFQSPATPRDTLLIEVAVEAVGRSSLRFRVASTIEAGGRACFSGTFVCVQVEGGTQSTSAAMARPLDPRIRIPAEIACSAAAASRAATEARVNG